MDDQRSYEEACRLFKWAPPERCNIAFDAVDRQAVGGADGLRTALIVETDTGTNHYSFEELTRWSNRMANLLLGWGIGAGDRVGFMLKPGAEAALSLLGILKTGAVAAPIPSDLDSPALAHALAVVAPSALIGDEESAPAIEAVVKALPGLKAALVANAPSSPLPDFWEKLREASEQAPVLPTGPDDPALLMLDGGGPGAALHGHRALKIRTAGAEYFFQKLPQQGDILWSLTGWADDGGWIEAVLPAWSMAMPVVVCPEGGALAFPTARGVRCVHLPARQLSAFKVIADGTRMQPRAILITGPVPEDDLRWLHRRFPDAVIPAMDKAPFGPLLAPAPVYGFETPKGAFGRPPPGYVIDVVDDQGRVLPAGEAGRLALHADSPLLPLQLFDRVLPNPAGRWLPLGTDATKDLDGTFWPYPPPSPGDPRDADDDPDAPIRLGTLDPADRWR